MNEACKNTDKQIWVKEGAEIDEGYLPSIYVTEGGHIGIKVGGTVIVKSVEDWHKLGNRIEDTKRLFRSSVKMWMLNVEIKYFIRGLKAGLKFKRRNCADCLYAIQTEMKVIEDEKGN